MRCRTYQKVYSPFFRKKVRRCKTMGAGRPRQGGYRASKRSKRARRGGYRRGHKPYNKGRKCVQMGTVYSSFFRKRVKRCMSWGGGKRGRAAGGGAEPGLVSQFFNPGAIPGGSYLPGASARGATIKPGRGFPFF